MKLTQEQKQLLLKDLCGRLPYGVKCQIDYDNEEDTDLGIERYCDDRIVSVCIETEEIGLYEASEYFYPNDIKPYLRPMSSMTEEENAILNNISNKDRGYEEDEEGWIRCDSIHTKWGVWPDGCAKLLDYLNSIHVDYRGLIPMGLALEAPEGMYQNR